MDYDVDIFENVKFMFLSLVGILFWFIEWGNIFCFIIFLKYVCFRYLSVWVVLKVYIKSIYLMLGKLNFYLVRISLVVEVLILYVVFKGGVY